LVSFNDSTHHPNDFCQKKFGISPAQQQERIAATNAYYGGDKPNGKIRLLVNWSILMLFSFCVSDPHHVAQRGDRSLARPLRPRLA
jgi:hypothetical protein